MKLEKNSLLLPCRVYFHMQIELYYKIMTIAHMERRKKESHAVEEVDLHCYKLQKILWKMRRKLM